MAKPTTKVKCRLLDELQGSSHDKAKRNKTDKSQLATASENPVVAVNNESGKRFKSIKRSKFSQNKGDNNNAVPGTSKSVPKTTKGTNSTRSKKRCESYTDNSDSQNEGKIC